MACSFLRLFCLLISVAFIETTIQAQQPAFPTAEGAGKFTTGGRGSVTVAPKIFEVTTLTDDASSATTPGTFRYACTTNSPSAPNRIIVFRIGGTIHLYATLTLTRANTTIAGQTAPGDGICIADYPVYVGANNMIIRYMRFRLGDKNQAASVGNDDAFSDNGNGRTNIIVDHCTMSWSNDEAFTFYKGDNITLQWNLISEPLDKSFHDEGAGVQNHAYGGIWGGKRASFHHNLFASCRGRMPRFDGIRNQATDTGDFRNNVIYNWADYNTNGGEGGTYNVVNNFYKWGPSTPNTTTSGVNRRSMVLNPYKQTSAPVLPYGRYYLVGNVSDSSAAVSANNWLGAAFNSGSFADSAASKVTDPFNAVAINMQSAQDAYTLVLANAGCLLPHRDTLDQRIIGDVRNRTGKLIDVQGGYPRGTPYSTSQTAWPALAAGTPQTDTDHDGMPDAWETQRGLNPASAADANGYNSTTGYNNIENYLNGDTLAAPGALNTCITAKTITATGSGVWLSANDSTYSDPLSSSYLAATDSVNAVAAILDNNNYGSFTASYYTTNTLRYDAYNHPYLNRNITIAPANAAAITSPVTVRIYFTRAEYDALKAADATINSLTDLRIVKVSGNACLSALSGSTGVITPTASGVFGSYGNGYYLEFSTASFSTFFITSAQSAITLPLHLLSFGAAINKKAADVKWIATNEVLLGRYNVERSIDGRSFEKVGSVQATNRPGETAYLFSDAAPVKGSNYYRLQMVDNSGAFSYSKTAAVNFGGADALSVVPNPAVNTIAVLHPKAATGTVLRIVSADGKTVWQGVADADALQTTVPVSALPAGVYRVLLMNGKNATSTTFLKQN